ncbi:hypothetical protein ACQPWW_09755 [Micromonospora sp. CA-240977]|uniref:hypothetical protein n=1 Tax=Micromonospora sp. CA-240977 TaxID=3239957 RepID=UPI003D93416A
MRGRLRSHLQADANFGRILVAYGGVVVVGSLGCSMLVDTFRFDCSPSSAPSAA